MFALPMKIIAMTCISFRVTPKKEKLMPSLPSFMAGSCIRNCSFLSASQNVIKFLYIEITWQCSPPICGRTVLVSALQRGSLEIC